MATTREGRPVDAGRLSHARIRGAVASASGERTPASTVVDAILIAGCMVAALGSVTGQQSVWVMLPDWWMPADVIMGVLASALLWWRRRHPVAVAVVLAVVGGVFISAAAPAIIAVYTVASLSRAWIAVAVTLLHLGIAIPYYLVVPIGGLGMLSWVVFMMLIYATALTLGLAVRARRQVIVALVTAAGRSAATRSCAPPTRVRPSAHGSPGRCTTCWRTGSRSCPSTRVPSSTGPGAAP